VPEPGRHVALDRDVCADLESATSREWWLANGIGGYASGTVAGALTRRYHGLLVAPLHPPLGRFLLIAKADAVLLDGEREIPLHTNLWGGGAVAPQGHRHISSFRLDAGMPVWEFAVDGLRIEQRIWMEHGSNRTRVAYRRLDGEPTAAPRIRLGLLASFRDHHGVNAPGGFQLHTDAREQGLRLLLPGGRFVDIHSPRGRFSPDRTWIENFHLGLEQERGLEASDAHLRIGWVEFSLEQDGWSGVNFGLDGVSEEGFEVSLDAERQRVQSLQTSALPGVEREDVPAWIRQLVTAADAYLFRRQGGSGRGRASVIAGYPWFGDWGRDTMIALPGLALATGRPQLAREVLESFAGYVDRGMLPNVFPGSGETPEYNTVDAALWFIEAWRAYYAASDDRDALAAVFPVLQEIVHAYRDGTRYGIVMDPADGLIRAGEPGQQLTWMDARVEGREITPRYGKPVEINALWYNALCAMAQMARVLDAPFAEFEALAGRAAAGFTRFDRGTGAGLFDVLDGPDGHEAAIRPNQIFALSLSFSPLTRKSTRREVLEECREHLFTPCGLRSLSPADSRYRGRYLGGVRERDGSYHQGPVWGWLLGHYAMAEYRVNGDAAAAQERLRGMAGQLTEAGLGQLSEIFDGDPPHAPRGAPAQAWSVACTLEAWWRLELALNDGK